MHRIHTAFTVVAVLAVAVVSIAAHSLSEHSLSERFLAARSLSEHSLIDQPKRFDYIVREAFFAGFAGDSVQLQYALDLCDDTLRVNPDHSQALVWHGSGIWFLSGQAFQTGNTARGMALADSGIREMDRAVELAPKSIGTLIPRGAALLASAPYIPGPYGKMLLEKAVCDYAAAYSLQRANLKMMSAHARGELIGGLADGYRALGNDAKARTYFTLLTTEVPGSEYAKRASTWLKQKSVVKPSKAIAPVTCIGCHQE
jgi:hypothetical protein